MIMFWGRGEGESKRNFKHILFEIPISNPSGFVQKEVGYITREMSRLEI